MADKTQINPTQLFELINCDPEDIWLKEHDLMPSGNSTLHVYHHASCPCQEDWYGLSNCTCDVLEYAIGPRSRTQ